MFRAKNHKAMTHIAFIRKRFELRKTVVKTNVLMMVQKNIGEKGGNWGEPIATPYFVGNSYC